MGRTVGGAVQSILGRDWDGTTDLSPYIETATVLVSRLNTLATRKGYTLSTAELELIERWMAAHYYTVMDPIYLSKRTADASATFPKRSYKDVAIEIDPSGALSSLLERKVAGMVWPGKPPSTQIDYDQRD